MRSARRNDDDREGRIARLALRDAFHDRNHKRRRLTRPRLRLSHNVDARLNTRYDSRLNRGRFDVSHGGERFQSRLSERQIAEAFERLRLELLARSRL